MALAFDHVFITVSSGRGKPSYRDATIPMGGTSHSPQALEMSAGLAKLCNLGALALKPAAEHHIELELDGARRSESHDFRPTLPLVLLW